MNSKIPALKPLLMAYASPEADVLTNHKEELWFFLDYEKALLCGERVIVGKEPVRVVDGRVLVVASAVENYLAKTLSPRLWTLAVISRWMPPQPQVCTSSITMISAFSCSAKRRWLIKTTIRIP